MARAIIFLFLIIAVATISVEAKPSCGENEVFNSCGSSCPSTCKNPNPSICTLACIPGCDCAEGYLRNADNKCVLTQNC